MKARTAAGSGIERRARWLRTVVGALAALSLALPTLPARAQSPTGEEGPPPPRGVIVAAPPEPGAPPVPSLAPSPTAPTGAPFVATPGATFAVTYDADFNANLPAKAAFQAAIDIWATKIRSTVTIRVNALLSDLGYDPLGGYALGFGGPTTSRRDFAGAPIANTWYPIALANALAGTDLAASALDMDLELNGNPNVPWFYGVSGDGPADQDDFLTAALHELGHGLGFLGSAAYGSPAPPNGCSAATSGCFSTIPFVYDRFTETTAGTSLLSFASPSVALGNQFKALHGNQFDGPYTRAAGGPALLHTPNSWSGSSYSHLDDNYSFTPNRMMTPSLITGTSVHDPGPLPLGMFQDMGWKLNTAARPPVDFDGNGASDVSVFRTVGSTWFERTTTPVAVAWGAAGDIPVPGDYDGDGNVDEAVYRPSNGVWYLRSTPTASIPWGAAGGSDIPVPADYDGDGDTDLAVFRPSSNVWYLRTATPASIVFGASGDVPVPGDYDGDGTADVGVFRPSSNVWYLRTAIPQAVPWGAAGDVPVPGDYDGDSRADIAVFRPSNATWYLRTLTPSAVAWGAATDVPVPGDYNADGLIDIAVFRPGTQIWYLRTPAPSSPAWGSVGDIPLALPYAVRRAYYP